MSRVAGDMDSYAKIARYIGTAVPATVLNGLSETKFAMRCSTVSDPCWLAVSFGESVFSSAKTL